MSDDAPTPPGWYPDPEQAATQRYWTGEAWTEQRAPLPPPRRDGDLSLGVALAIIIPLVGFFYGVWMLARGNGNGGWVMVFAVFAGIAWTLILTALMALA